MDNGPGIICYREMSWSRNFLNYFVPSNRLSHPRFAQPPQPLPPTPSPTLAGHVFLSVLAQFAVSSLVLLPPSHPPPPALPLFRANSVARDTRSYNGWKRSGKHIQISGTVFGENPPPRTWFWRLAAFAINHKLRGKKRTIILLPGNYNTLLFRARLQQDERNFCRIGVATN